MTGTRDHAMGLAIHAESTRDPCTGHPGCRRLECWLEAQRSLIFYHGRGTIAPKFRRGWEVVTVIFRDKTWEVKAGSTVRHIIETSGLNPESVLAVRDGRLINDATLTKDGDTIKLVAVVSGG